MFPRSWPGCEKVGRRGAARGGGLILGNELCPFDFEIRAFDRLSDTGGEFADGH
jgi:hypothetical protein